MRVFLGQGNVVHEMAGTLNVACGGFCIPAPQTPFILSLAPKQSMKTPKILKV